MPTSVISIDDGRRDVTVSDLLGNPETIPTRVLDRVRDQFIAETLLYNGGTSNKLEFSFEQNSQSFVDGDPEVIAEFAEFPTVSETTGKKVVGRATKIGFRLEISREMRDYNELERVNKRVDKAVNTLIRFNDKQLWDALAKAPIPEIAASVAWDQSGADQRYDIARAMEKVGTGSAEAIDDLVDPFFADTIVMNKAVAPSFIASEKWNNVYTGNLADKSIRYTGVIESKPMGLDALMTRTLPRNKVLVLQRGALGFFKDPRRLEATPMRGIDEQGGDTETFRSRISQIRFVGIEEPFSACWITGVMS
ncbi:hypothetical protein WG936_08180 [Corynebacterium sp. H127]|uniref:phage major capsid protein n=1 Tax=Corynebacterium sp. H127 TaxID=3133418 RepID=UPI00309EA513